jgi:hypothetical protein
MRGVALDLHFSPRLSEDGQFGEVRKDQGEGDRILQRHFITESTLHHSDSVEPMGAVHAIDIEFSLIETFEGSL